MRVGIIFFLLFINRNAFSDAVGIGVGWRHIEVKKYSFFDASAFEIRYSILNNNATAYIFRSYWNYINSYSIKFFSGIETGYLNIKDNNTEFRGYESGLFLGAEYYLTKSIAISLDIGYVIFVIVEDDASRYSSYTPVNFSLYCYFGR